MLNSDYLNIIIIIIIGIFGWVGCLFDRPKCATRRVKILSEFYRLVLNFTNEFALCFIRICDDFPLLSKLPFLRYSRSRLTVFQLFLFFFFLNVDIFLYLFKRFKSMILSNFIIFSLVVHSEWKTLKLKFKKNIWN